ncbi:phosphatase PAP2 family protein [Sphingopyxis sp. C-1]|uniref:phosphatase PAP2 family protein n=1 Tax=Sphingopyxis sp. C-1 TaxID=262667 RepID=UPI0009FA787C|nr:phosphatase PAP2 family protein [Sphingopyxis sp. C-1]
MTSTSSLLLRLDPGDALTKWDGAFTREELVPSIIVACASALLFSGLGILWFFANVALRPPGASIPLIFALAIVTAGYCTFRFSPVIATVLGFILAVQLGKVLGAEAGYLIYSAGRGFPLIDAQLYAADQWLGFDWLTMLHRFGDYPALVHWTRIAYDQAGIQAMLALPVLILARQNDRLMKLLAATFLSLVAVHLIAVLLPAVGAYGYLQLTAADHPQMALSSEGRTVVHVMQLRTGALFDLNRSSIMGLITFPSFHTIMAIQAAWAFWRIPALRWPAVGFNLLVWIGTLFHGSHHLTDTFAGAIVAGVSVYAACALTTVVRNRLYPGDRRFDQSPRST